jgi:curli biogenesis system outer membrane secretion channel CsgG
MKRMLVAGVLVLASTVSALAAGDGPLRAGILPFDVVSVDGAQADTSTALAKLVRIEMIKGRKLTPVLLTLPSGAETPVPPDAAATIGKSATVSVVIVGTVIDASVTHSTRSASTGGLLGSIGVGGEIDRANARVSLHIDLVDPATGKIADSFDVEGKSSETGVGMDFSTALGGLNQGGDAWEKTPMGKALSEAARKVNDEVVKRASKFGR